MSAIQQIESESWKGELGQDMWSRGQNEVYAAIVASSRALVRVASISGRPIAYRLDYSLGNEVFVMKWSYSESARRLSPGFYMLVVDLPVTHAGADIDVVDLYGSPDTLKSSIQDAGADRRRCDMAFPADHPDLEKLRIERFYHDERIAAALTGGHSVRTLYA